MPTGFQQANSQISVTTGGNDQLDPETSRSFSAGFVWSPWFGNNASWSERFDVEYDWDGDVLNFARSGVDGRIALQPRQLHVTASLGFLLSALKGPIEAEIRRVLDEKF